jgi:isopentenyl-diphosphate delta-isomerase
MSSSEPGAERSASDGVAHENAGEDVVAVSEDDEPEGTVNRLEAHTGEGTRHRAFTCMLFDETDRILLAQRAPTKRLWDTHWDGTVASHPTADQSQEEATRERLSEELGLEPRQYRDLRITDRFEYRRHYLNEGLEWEVCAVLKATITDPTFARDLAEVGGLLWVDYHDLHENPRYYRQLRLCPWFEIAMRRDLD